MRSSCGDFCTSAIIVTLHSKLMLQNNVRSFYYRCLNGTTQQQLFYGRLSGTTRVSRYQKKHSPTHHPDHHPIFITFFRLLRSIVSSLLKLHASQSFCTTSLHVFFGLPLGLEPSPHIPYISSPNQCLLFATYAHTIATCFAVVSILYHLFLIFLSTPYLELCLSPYHLHIHLTVLIYAC